MARVAPCKVHAMRCVRASMMGGGTCLRSRSLIFGDMMAAATFTISSVVRGYHVYKDVWNAAQGEVLPCRSDTANLHDPFAVSVVQNGQTVGHVPRRISAACSMFLRRNGTINCHVTGTRQYSTDLPQGGLEIPCELVFTGAQNDICKLERIFDAAASLRDKKVSDECNKIIKPSEEIEVEGDAKHAKRRRIDSEENQSCWVKIKGMTSSFTLSFDDYHILSGGMKLSDQHMNASQILLKSQFPSVQGLGLTYKPPCFGKWVETYIQIIHTRSSHWITCSTIGCTAGTVNIYDSSFSDIDNDGLKTLENILGSPLSISFPQVPKQVGTKDCGLFAIAFAVFLASEKDYQLISTVKFHQNTFRQHLIDCLEKGTLTNFFC